MQHKKYQRKYKFSLVFGPTLWGHHICLVVFIAGKWIIAVPVQRHYGYKKLYKYMEVQGIKKDNIKEITSFKNYLDGSYNYKVKLKDPEGYSINYIYTHYKEIMVYSIEYNLNGKYKSLDVNERKKFKYPPLPFDWEDKLTNNK
ncbi:DUF3139 domain-containing protein [Finegoldia magna]|uniref:DUF3139 domain-containing protein n=1 Tax=Finegoldia magna TaxID=1260 RepID=UPI0023A9BA56|nr:DUF3139 domain-containing protein [Finegoldia magna]MCC2718101.1 DUF3139 domain-containing protein [Finegoldia magna]